MNTVSINKKKFSFVLALSISFFMVMLNSGCAFFEPTNKLTAIIVNRKPTQLNYYQGEKLNLSGLEIQGKYYVYKNSNYQYEYRTINDYESSPADGDVLTDIGVQKVTITYNGESASFDINVLRPKQVTSISISSKPYKTKYEYGEKLDLTGLKVNASYDNYTNALVDDYTVSPSLDTALTTPGTITVLISYQGKETSFNITVGDRKPYSIYISKKPTKLIYFQGDELDLSGLEITAKYDDNSESVINNWTASPSENSILSETGIITITVSYYGKQTSFYVTVEPKISSIYINKKPKKLDYHCDETLELTGLEVKARYSNNSEKIITGWTSSPAENSKLSTIGTVNITITYEEKTTSFTVNVKEKAINQAFWGTWIRMDTGEEYYIDDEKIYKLDYYNSVVQTGIRGYSLESENILCNGNIRYFRKGGSARNFSISVSGFNDSKSRAAATNTDIKINRKNTKNPLDTQTLTPDTTGKTNFTGSIADDAQEIRIVTGLNTGTSGSETSGSGTSTSEEQTSISVSVTPSYDGQDMGTIPIVEKGMYGFKVTHSINADKQGFLYGNYYSTYDLSLDINNIGTESCSTSVYSISTNDSGLEFISGNLNGNFSSIEPGKSKKVSLKIRYGKLEEEYVDVPISISVQDSKYSRTWNDCVTLRFYKGLVPLKINSRNFDSNSNAKLNGFVIYPDGRSARFTVSAGNTTTVQIPWSKSDYHLAFSGATATNEMAYSFGFDQKTTLADLNGTWSISEINSYEPNNKIELAKKITDLTSPVKSYLMDGDIDYYTINNSEIEIKFKPVLYSARAISDATKYSDVNNGDSSINPGETIMMDIRLNNSTSQMISDITATLSTTSEYVTIAEATKNYGNISGEYYKSLYGVSEYADDSRYKNGSSSQSYDSAYLNASYGWQFSVAENTPVDTEIPFTLSFTDSRGNKWSDSFSLKVVKADVNIVLAGYGWADSKSISSAINDDCGYNAGETINWDIRIKNEGSTTAKNLICKLSSTSSYIKFLDNICDYGSLASNCHKTSYTASSSTGYTAKDSASFYASSNPGYVFTIESSTPANTKIPIIVTITDNQKNTWTDTITITVVEPYVKLSYISYAFSDKMVTGKMNDNDGIIEAGEQIYMNACIKNTGTSRADNVAVSFTSTSEYISFSTSSRNYGTIQSDYYKAYNINASNAEITSMDPANNYACCFTISNTTPSGTVIPIKIKMADGKNNTFYHTLEIKIQ